MPHAAAPHSRVPVTVMLASATVSLLGSAATVVALPLLVLSLTGSPFHLGLVSAFEAIGMALGNTLGGAMSDRFGPGRTSMLGSLGAGALLLLVPGLSAIGLLSVPVLCAIGLTANICGTTGGVSRRGLIPPTARRAGISVDRGEALYQTIMTTGYVIGIALAGVLTTAVSLPVLILLDSASFGVAAVLVACVPGVFARTRPARGEGEDGPRGSLFSDWVDGLRLAWENPLVRVVLLSVTGLFALIVPLTSVVMPLYASQPGAPQGAYGWMLGAQVAGSLAGAGLYTLFADRLVRHRLILFGLIGYAASMLAVAAVPWFPARVAAFALAGLCGGPLTPVVLAVIRRLTPEAAHGRILGIFFALSTTMGPLSNITFGALLEWAPLWTIPLSVGLVFGMFAVPLAAKVRAADRKVVAAA